MKKTLKIICVCAFVALTTLTACAQDDMEMFGGRPDFGPGGPMMAAPQRPDIDEKEVASKRVARLTAPLQLDKKQQKKLTNLFAKDMKARKKAAQEEYGVSDFDGPMGGPGMGGPMGGPGMGGRGMGGPGMGGPGMGGPGMGGPGMGGAPKHEMGNGKPGEGGPEGKQFGGPDGMEMEVPSILPPEAMDDKYKAKYDKKLRKILSEEQYQKFIMLERKPKARP